MRAGRSHRRVGGWRATSIAVVAAAGLHGGLLAAGWSVGGAGSGAPAALIPTTVAISPVEVAEVRLLDRAPEGDELVAVWGPEAQALPGAAHVRPRSADDTAGDRAAAGGSVGAGGPLSAGERIYRERAQRELWNGLPDYRQPRVDRGRRPGADEWTSRTPRPGASNRYRNKGRVARAGHKRGATGAVDGIGVRDDSQRGDDSKWDSADPIFDRGGRRRIAQRQPGQIASAELRPQVTRGEQASDTGRRARSGDNRDVSAASQQLRPDTLDLASPESGGRSRGVRGPAARLGQVAGARRGRGTASTSRDVARGVGGAVKAHRGNPYFRRLYDRVDREVRYPRELAIRYQQGQAVVRFRLRADGTIAGLVLTRNSGFQQLDREALRAIRAAAPFGRVPDSVLRGRAHVLVSMPYAFRAPIIR